MALDAPTGAEIVALKNRIVSAFNDSEWLELGTLTDEYELIDNHPRLLRSLRFNDPDYEGCVLSVLRTMIERNTANLEVIRQFVESKYPSDDGENVSSLAKERRIVFSPSVFEIPTEPVDNGLVSVMMPFEAAFSAVYDSINQATSEAGLKCQRADNIWQHSVVIQDVFSLIFRSFIVVCDFTGRNPNVFYEAGIAHTLGKHVIPITQSADDIPFDLRHHRFLKYLNNAQGRMDMKGELLKRLRTLTVGQRFPVLL